MTTQAATEPIDTDPFATHCREVHDKLVETIEGLAPGDGIVLSRTNMRYAAAARMTQACCLGINELVASFCEHIDLTFNVALGKADYDRYIIAKRHNCRTPSFDETPLLIEHREPTQIDFDKLMNPPFSGATQR